MKPDWAPVGRHFISIEGESTRVGQLTGFVVLGDGRMRSVDDVFDEFYPPGDFDGPGPALNELMQCIVLNVCEVTYFDWTAFATRFIGYANEESMPMVLETRGGRAFDRGHVRLYLHLTPGYTTVEPEQLREGDEVKMLVHHAEDVPSAIDALTPFAEAGIPSFIMPRVSANKAKPIFERFLEEGPGRIRMMLVEHEVVGIE